MATTPGLAEELADWCSSRTNTLPISLPTLYQTAYQLVVEQGNKEDLGRS